MFQLFKKIFRKKGNHQQTKQMKRRVVYSMKSNENDISDRYQSNQIDDDKKKRENGFIILYLVRKKYHIHSE